MPCHTHTPLPRRTSPDRLSSPSTACHQRPPFPSTLPCCPFLLLHTTDYAGGARVAGAAAGAAVGGACAWRPEAVGAGGVGTLCCAAAGRVPSPAPGAEERGGGDGPAGGGARWGVPRGALAPCAVRPRADVLFCCSRCMHTVACCGHCCLMLPAGRPQSCASLFALLVPVHAGVQE